MDIMKDNDDGSTTVTPTDGKTGVRFRGKKLGDVSTARPNSRRWTELHVWQTEGGSVVLAEVGNTSEPGDQVYCSVKVYDDMDAMTEALGYTKLSQRLYRTLGIAEVSIR